ncbi:hypothetical protein RJ639_017511, partial [Escallonia herrerae]
MVRLFKGGFPSNCGTDRRVKVVGRSNGEGCLLLLKVMRVAEMVLAGAGKMFLWQWARVKVHYSAKMLSNISIRVGCCVFHIPLRSLHIQDDSDMPTSVVLHMQVEVGVDIGRSGGNISLLLAFGNSSSNSILVICKLKLSSAGLGWKSWKKRWFILTRTSLVFFKNDPSALPQRGGEVNLTLGGIDLNNSGSVVVREDKKLLTVLFPDGRDGRAFTLKAESSDDLYEWKTALEHALAQAPSAALVMGHNGIFRNDANDTIEGSFNQWRDKRPVKSLVVGRPILLALEDIDGGPSFLEKALRFLEKYGTNVEGILRQSADVEEVDRRVQEYEQGKSEFATDEDAHVIGDCVKYLNRSMFSENYPHLLFLHPAALLCWKLILRRRSVTHEGVVRCKGRKSHRNGQDDTWKQCFGNSLSVFSATSADDIWFDRNVFADVLAVEKIDRKEARVNAMRSAILETFPEPNRRLLQRILKMMHTISLHASENRMTPSAVAACMAPLLLRPLLAGECELEDDFDMNGDSSAQLLAAANAANNAQAIITTLLEEYENIFDEDAMHRCSISADSQIENSGSEDSSEDENLEIKNNGYHDAQNEAEQETDDDADRVLSGKLSESSGYAGSDLYDYK